MAMCRILQTLFIFIVCVYSGGGGGGKGGLGFSLFNFSFYCYYYFLSVFVFNCKAFQAAQVLEVLFLHKNSKNAFKFKFSFDTFELISQANTVNRSGALVFISLLN